MKDSIKLFGSLVLIVAVIGGIIYGSWKLERWWNYRAGYQGLVQKDMKPLVERIEALEKRVTELEK